MGLPQWLLPGVLWPEVRVRMSPLAGPPLVHYLTRHLTIACQPGRTLEGAPLNTVNKNQVTCPACADAITGEEPAP